MGRNSLCDVLILGANMWRDCVPPKDSVLGIGTVRVCGKRSKVTPTFP